MSAALDALDAAGLRTALVLHGREATLYPMLNRPNGAPQPDPDRAVQPLAAIRSEWTDRMQTGDNGMGRASGTFRASVESLILRATVARADCAWMPQRGDEFSWGDRPGLRYRIAEIRPDGGAGLHLKLNQL